MKIIGKIVFQTGEIANIRVDKNKHVIYTSTQRRQSKFKLRNISWIYIKDIVGLNKEEIITLITKPIDGEAFQIVIYKEFYKNALRYSLNLT